MNTCTSVPRKLREAVFTAKITREKLLEVVVLVLVVTIPPLISIYMHDPKTEILFGNFGFKYNDIVHGLANPIFTSNKRWFNTSTYQSFRDGHYKYPVPYIDYKFEYPPVVGLIWYLSTSTAFTCSSNLEEAIRLHYYIQSVVITAFYAVLVYSIYSLLKTTRRSVLRLLVFLLPSTFTYMIYNWDVIAAAFAILGVLLILREKYFLSGLLQGFSVSTKILTIGVAFYYIVKLLIVEKRRKPGLKFLVGFTISGVLPFILFYIISSRGFLEFLHHHSSWYCENCIYLLVIQDIFSSVHKVLFYTVITVIASTFLLFGLPWRGISVQEEFKYLFLAVTSLVLFNYVFSPQMLLMITPLAILTLKPLELVVFALVDVFNALIIYTFFKYPNPWLLGSVAQNMALMRNLLLLLLFVINAASITWTKLKKELIELIKIELIKHVSCRDTTL